MRKGFKMSSEQVPHLISASTWGGALMATAGALSLSEWLAVVGAACAVVGLVINVFHKRFLRRVAEQELKLRKRELDLKYGVGAE